MSAAEPFFDTNVLLYLLSADDARADRVEDLLCEGAVISVQVLNEFTSVATRKLGLSLAEVRDALEPIKAICNVAALELRTHETALAVAERTGFSIYDSLIIAAALHAGSRTLYTEDLQHGQVIEKSLTIIDPFRSLSARPGP